jgi:DNA-binding NtrC family response regulator
MTCKAERLPEQTGREKLILVAEDDETVRGWLMRVLEHEGYSVLAASNGVEAATIASDSRPDLLITDLWMPKMNGVELLELLGGRRCRFETIVLSAHLTNTCTQKLEDIGVFRGLSKPIETPVLVNTVAEALASKRSERLRRAAEGARPDRDSSAMVLVADDDDGVRDFLRVFLTREGYRVEEARDGEEGVEKALAMGIELVIFDINMPRMNGIEALKHLRRTLRDCFVICTTGESSQKELNAAMLAGASACLRKPFDLDKLSAEVRRLDLVAAHRRRYAASEKERLAEIAGRSLRERLAAWLQDCHRVYGWKLKWLAIGAVVGVGLLALSVPSIVSWMSAAADRAATTVERMENAADGVSRMEEYLRRDEQRELKRR